MKLKICELVINADKINNTKIETILESKNKAIQNYAYILHDKDTYQNEKEAALNDKKIGDLKSPHYHIYLRFNNSYDTKHIAQWFNTEDNFVSKIKGRFSDALMYMIHANRSDKHQYDEKAVVSNFDWKSEAQQDIFLRKYKIDSRLQEILFKIQSGEIKEYNITNHISIIENNIYSATIEKAFKYRTNTLKGLDRQMECVFITGISGSGKTTLAKKIAKDNNYQAYISSGSNDVLDDYRGEECIILDDLRSNCLGLSDLLKMLDNNTASSVKSRYKNKVLECKLIIITTVKTIDDFFEDIFKKDESIIQLKRRCKLHINIDSKYIYYSVWNQVDMKYDKPFKKPNTLLNKFQLKKLNEKEQKAFIKKTLNIDLDI
ncbi:AAA family ATPase ['Fragaria x ananassa' phyllody phytoplasma]|uniref:AAA family ATPase n=1 Tax='Fragaria x ananassa' phyllody phytoplasma TaxID=2358428 RepID=A0ABS5K450_9MOLU|nr:Rep family protein ['Fragaria x ananassa' phyllody phytoplasma]MBS2126564.1 AAA family ATPase ['Fragaria x ananassa' phyllody phytoplasma]MBS2126568.1 AAA family ATPase ['Fragaria x ananassa' phyllody phytoplasma]